MKPTKEQIKSEAEKIWTWMAQDQIDAYILGAEWAIKQMEKKPKCKHIWLMTADPFDQTCYCKKCGKMI